MQELRWRMELLDGCMMDGTPAHQYGMIDAKCEEVEMYYFWPESTSYSIKFLVGSTVSPVAGDTIERYKKDFKK